MPNYLIYPFREMRITQNYNGTTSHIQHTLGTTKDYPNDEGGHDQGRDWMYCPCDEMVIKRIYGVGNQGVNTIWLESTSKVLFADGVTDYACMLAEHANDDDLRKLREGQKFRRKDPICREGMDGASGNHIHYSIGRGKFSGNGWTSVLVKYKGKTYTKYVLTTTGGAIKPEKAFWIDPNFTKIVSSAGLSFKTLPVAKYKTGKYKVVEKAPVRKEPSTKSPKLTFRFFTEGAREQIKSLSNNKAKDYFVPGVVFTASEVKENDNHWWGKCPSGWVCLEHCKKV